MEKKDVPPVTYLDNPGAPEVFASEASGFFVLNGVVTITLASARIDHSTSPGPVNRVVVGRLAMSIYGVQNLYLGLGDFLKKQGLDPAPPVPKENLN